MSPLYCFVLIATRDLQQSKLNIANFCTLAISEALLQSKLTA